MLAGVSAVLRWCICVSVPGRGIVDAAGGRGHLSHRDSKARAFRVPKMRAAAPAGDLTRILSLLFHRIYLWYSHCQNSSAQYRWNIYQMGVKAVTLCTGIGGVLRLPALGEEMGKHLDTMVGNLDGSMSSTDLEAGVQRIRCSQRDRKTVRRSAGEAEAAAVESRSRQIILLWPGNSGLAQGILLVLDKAGRNREREREESGRDRAASG